MQKSLYTREYQRMLMLLREKRVQADVSQGELAKRLGWSQAEISKCETGVRRIDVVELKTWLQALEISLADFVLELYGI